MKKILIICLVLVCILCIGVFLLWNNNDVSNITLNNIKDSSEELIKSKLIGRDIEQIKLMFGEPNASLSGMYGIIYEIVKDEKNIVIFFNNNNKVSDVKLRIDEPNINNSVSVKEFQFGFLLSKTPKVIKVLNNNEINENNEKYNLYYYGFAEINIILDENDVMPLKEALLSGKITLEEIIEKANKDVEKTEERYSEFEEYQSMLQIYPYSDMYKDGGSKMYYYEEYNILKCNTLSGNKDIYIGISEMKINDVLK